MSNDSRPTLPTQIANLEAANAKLTAEIATLRAENQQLKGKVSLMEYESKAKASAPAPAPVHKPTQNLFGLARTVAALKGLN